MSEWVDVREQLIIIGDGKPCALEEAFEKLNSQESVKMLMKSLADR